MIINLNCQKDSTSFSRILDIFIETPKCYSNFFHVFEMSMHIASNLTEEIALKQKNADKLMY